MKRLLVALDFTDAAESLVNTALTLAKALDADVLLLHTEPPEPDFVGYDVGPQYVRNDLAADFRRDEEALEVFGDRLRQAGVNTKCLLIQGPTVDKIIKEATAFDADCILVGGHEHGAFYHLLFGSVVESLFRRAPCAVLMVPASSDTTAPHRQIDADR